ncbi:hypothetical protein ACIO93_32320 [Streptomyces sp. NPDC087903]|uniref:hypothetical protein n=1 Tax=Streptomyces sp. NPDC087903 TaxID=3365819 RepID=UPI0037F156F9
MEACGCGEDQIPWMLAKFGLLGTAGLVLGTLALMILTGWLLATAVWLARRRRGRDLGPGRDARDTGAEGGPPPAASRLPRGPLGGFTWHADDS